jgi:hypothetical protein
MPDTITSDHTVERPSQVSRAAALYLAALVLGVINSAYLWHYPTSLGTAGFVVSVPVVTLAVMTWIVIEIWQGRNWARITYLVLTLLGLPLYVPNLLKFFAVSGVTGSINTLQFILELVALGLLFIGPGAAWLRRPRSLPLNREVTP